MNEARVYEIGSMTSFRFYYLAALSFAYEIEHGHLQKEQKIVRTRKAGGEG